MSADVWWRKDPGYQQPSYLQCFTVPRTAMVNEIKYVFGNVLSYQMRQFYENARPTLTIW